MVWNASLSDPVENLVSKWTTFDPPSEVVPHGFITIVRNTMDTSVSLTLLYKLITNDTVRTGVALYTPMRVQARCRLEQS